VLAAPFAAAWLSRRTIRGRWGEETLGVVAEGALGLTSLGLAFVVFIISALKAHELIARPQVFLKLLVCVPLLMAMLAAAAFLWARAFRMGYEDFVGLAVTSATKNAALALALATVAFGPEAALPIAMGGPFLQVPGVLLLARLAPRLKRLFPKGR
jgi:ACR3 family arsenite transporter